MLGRTGTHRLRLYFNAYVIPYLHELFIAPRKTNVVKVTQSSEDTGSLSIQATCHLHRGQFPRTTGLYRQIENSRTFLCGVRYDQPTRVQSYKSSQSNNQSIHPLVCLPAVLYRVREAPQDYVMHIPHHPTLLPLFLCMLCVFIQVHAHIVCIHVCICICMCVYVVANGLICTWVFKAASSTEHGDWLVWLANEFHQSARLYTTILLLG